MLKKNNLFEVVGAFCNYCGCLFYSKDGAILRVVIKNDFFEVYSVECHYCGYVISTGKDVINLQVVAEDENQKSFDTLPTKLLEPSDPNQPFLF